MKRAFSFLPFILFFCLLLFFPRQSLLGAKTGLMLWFFTLLPSMLPFLILSSLFVHLEVLEKLFGRGASFWRRAFGLSPQGTYALFMGIFCGYPMGAKVTADLYRGQRITRQEADYLLTFSCHPGPSFLSAYLCVEILEREDVTGWTYLVIYLSSFLCSLMFRPSRRRQSVPETPAVSAPFRENLKKETSVSLSLGEALDASILNAFLSITKLGGYMILFSVLQSFLKTWLPAVPCIRYPVLGLMEITTGLSALSQSRLPFSLLYILTVSFTSFGGLCVAAQTKSMLADTDLSLIPYLKGKLCCLTITLALTFFLVEVVKVIV